MAQERTSGGCAQSRAEPVGEVANHGIEKARDFTVVQRALIVL
jgi:hypothetical protein